jgi:hypothetical protein
MVEVCLDWLRYQVTHSRKGGGSLGSPENNRSRDVVFVVLLHWLYNTGGELLLLHDLISVRSLSLSLDMSVGFHLTCGVIYPFPTCLTQFQYTQGDNRIEEATSIGVLGPVDGQQYRVSVLVVLLRPQYIEPTTAAPRSTERQREGRARELAVSEPFVIDFTTHKKKINPSLWRDVCVC